MSIELSQQAVSLNNIIADRLRGEFVQLLPPETWAGLVKQELQRFTQPITGYGGPTASPLQAIIREELEKKLREAIREELSTPPYLEMWQEGKYRPGSAIRDILKELTPDLVQNMFEGVIEATVCKLRSSL